jgi:hypothetical protein
MPTKTTTTPVKTLPESLIHGAEAGYKVRSAVVSATQGTGEALCSTFNFLKGAKLGLFGVSEPKPKPEPKRTAPTDDQLKAWLKNYERTA